MIKITKTEDIQKYIEQNGKKIWNEGKDHLKEYGFDEETADFLVAIVVARLFFK